VESGRAPHPAQTDDYHVVHRHPLWSWLPDFNEILAHMKKLEGSRSIFLTI
jgi:hypothetical protein